MSPADRPPLTWCDGTAPAGPLAGSPTWPATAGDLDRWLSEAARTSRWVEQNAWSEQRGAYVWYPGSDQLDASIVLHAISGYDRGERMSDAGRAALGAGPHLYRFSGAAHKEGAFLACSHWMVSALQLCGRGREARELMEKLMTAPEPERDVTVPPAPWCTAAAARGRSDRLNSQVHR